VARSFTNNAENFVLEWMFVGSVVYTPSPGNLTMRLALSFPTDAASFTVPGGSYVEQAITFSSPVSGVITNSNTVTFPVATVPWGKVVGYAIRDTVGTVTLATGYMGTFYDYVSEILSSDRIDCVGGVAPADDTIVFFSNRDADGNQIAFLSAVDAVETAGAGGIGTTYYVVQSSGSNFKVSATKGGAPITIATTDFDGAPTIWLSQIRNVNIGDQLVFAPGSISISLK
jgi:hypothetical protein